MLYYLSVVAVSSGVHICVSKFCAVPEVFGLFVVLDLRNDERQFFKEIMQNGFSNIML